MLLTQLREPTPMVEEGFRSGWRVGGVRKTRCRKNVVGYAGQFELP